MPSSKSAPPPGKGVDVAGEAKPSGATGDGTGAISSDTQHAGDLAAITAGRLPQRLTLITLGVADLVRARAFYEQLGFGAAEFPGDEVAFFDMGGVVLGLFDRTALADDAGVAASGAGFRGVSCALNLDSEAAVDAALKFAGECGAELVKPAERVFWGGYSGYFADPDGHLWEVAFNPVFKLNDRGHMTLPAPAAD